MGKNQLFTRIGEKINPSALKKVANDIRTGSVSGIKEVAKAQEEAGATMLDVNLGLAGGDEVKSFERVIPELASFTGLPLCIDTTHPVALEEALKLYPGRALINSISGEKERIETVLPVMKKYGSYAVLLPLDEEGIPETVEKREKIIKHILKEADKLGIPASRFIVDALVMTISAAESMVDVSLETVRKATEMGLCTTCGLSNVSFGLPGRNGINAAFLAMLMGAGLDSAILNPQDELLGLTIDAGNVLSGRDEHASKYIEKYQAQKNISFGTSQKSGTEGILAEKLLKFLDTIEK
jgi:5-methyltetrahydrofolate--homocysteine methyltransferase